MILVAAGLLWKVVQMSTGGPKEAEATFSEFTQKVDQGLVKEVNINGMEVRGKYTDGGAFHTTVPAAYPDMYKALQAKNVVVTIHDLSGGNWSLVLNLLPFALLAGLWFFMIRQMQTGGNKALSFGKSRARLLSMQQKKITFKDVAGVDEAKEELKEIIEFLSEAQKFQKLGGRIPKGVLLVGPPGTGKPCWPGQSPAKPAFRSSPSPVRISWRCSSASAQAVCAICLNKARRTLLASSSSTKSTRSDVIAVPVSAAVTMSANRH